MQLTITILTTVLATLANVPDLCGDVYLNVDGSPCTDSQGRTLSRFCPLHGLDAPVWDDDVCCSLEDDTAACVEVDANGRCPSGLDRMSCKYGESLLGGVVCYQPAPTMCDLGLCVQAPDDLPPGGEEIFGACCGVGGCHPVTWDNVTDCDGEYTLCLYGMSNADGTVECFN